jgi:hypothetical protein
MKNYKKYIGCLSLSVLTLIGCEDLKFGEKFLDKPISNEQNIDSVFNKKVYAEQALAETYHSCRIICRCKDVWDMAFWKC